MAGGLLLNATAQDVAAAMEAVASAAASHGVVVQVTDCSGGSDAHLALGVASVFVIFAVSLVGFLTPILMASAERCRWAQVGGAALAFVGTAILVTVGFIHILGDATRDLSSPCLPPSFVLAYPSWALLVCVAVVLVMMMVDFAAQGRIETLSSRAAAAAKEEAARAAGDEEAAADAEARAAEQAALRAKRAIVGIVELTVCTHSVPVGLDLGLKTQLGLFIAIIFHQLLEGLGVGAAVADARLPLRTSLIYAALFATTCPLGITLGLALQKSISNTSRAYLLLLGSVNAAAAGLLIYTGLIHMNAFTSRGAWLRAQGWRVQALCFGCFIAAGAAMLALGKWA